MDVIDLWKIDPIFFCPHCALLSLRKAVWSPNSSFQAQKMNCRHDCVFWTYICWKLRWRSILKYRRPESMDCRIQAPDATCSDVTHGRLGSGGKTQKLFGLSSSSPSSTWGLDPSKVPRTFNLKSSPSSHLKNCFSFSFCSVPLSGTTIHGTVS